MFSGPYWNMRGYWSIYPVLVYVALVKAALLIVPGAEEGWKILAEDFEKAFGIRKC